MKRDITTTLDAALNMHLIVLGKTRSAKSSVLRLLVEQVLDQYKPVCIVDPPGWVTWHADRRRGWVRLNDNARAASTCYIMLSTPAPPFHWDRTYRGMGVAGSHT
jgi:hypothetical protein